LPAGEFAYRQHRGGHCAGRAAGRPAAAAVTAGVGWRRLCRGLFGRSLLELGNGASDLRGEGERVDVGLNALQRGFQLLIDGDPDVVDRRS